MDLKEQYDKLMSRKNARYRTYRKYLVEKLDDLTREKCFEVYGRVCYTCSGAKGDPVIECGHLITRSKYATRWDIRNVRPQCPSCNLEHEHNPHTYSAKYVKENGLDAYEELIAESWNSQKITVLDLEYIYLQLMEV